MSKFNEYIKRMEGAKYKSAAPAIGLLIVGGLTIAMSVLILVLGIIIAVYSLVEENVLEKNNPEEMMMFGGIAVVWWLLSLLMGFVYVFAGYQMRTMASYGMALAGVIASMVVSILSPCFLSYFGCCSGWILGLPISIWALVIILDPTVKERFSA